jgi:hypothetical protein
MGASFKTAFCVKCSKDQPFRIVKVPEPSRPLSTRWKTRKKRLCMVCSEEVASTGSKYRNEPTRSKHTGRLYQSRKESRREPVLLALQNAGQITDLQYQVPYRLELYATGAVDELVDFLESAGTLAARDSERTIARLVGNVRRSRQYLCKWSCDFQYRDREGRLVIEDVKSVATATPVYKLKKKLMVLAHNVEIVEPEEGGIQQRARGAGIRGRGTGSRLFGGR